MKSSEELWEALQGLPGRMDPVPAAVLAAARDSLSWRDTDAALAQLTEETTAAAVRGQGPPDLLTFTAGDFTIEIELAADGTRLRLTGQLVPPQAARVTVDHPAGPTEAQADEVGRFAVDAIARGNIRLTCYPAEGDGPVRTAWTLI